MTENSAIFNARHRSVPIDSPRQRRRIVELTEQTRQAVDDYVRAAAKKPGEFMFTGRPGSEQSITTRQYARLVSEWIACIGLDHIFSAPTHYDGPRQP